MWTYLAYFFIFFIGLCFTSARKEVITFNVDPSTGFEGYFDERTRQVELKLPIEAHVAPGGVSASGQICGFNLWSRRGDPTALPFLIVRQPDGKGEIRAKAGASITYAEHHRFSFLVQAFDCDPIRHVSAKVPVSLHVIPNERPIWTQSSYLFSVREHQPAGTKVGSVNATEHGTDLNQRMCSYSIVRPQDAPFDVDGNGVIWTRRTLYYSEVVNYILRVKAEDCWVPKSRSSLVSVNIRVLPVCQTGWQGIFAQINYRAGSGSRALFDEQSLPLVASCDPASPAVKEVSLQLILQPGDRAACPQTNGCPLATKERIGRSGAGHRLDFTAESVPAATKWLKANLFYVNGELEPGPSKREAHLRTAIRFAGSPGHPEEIHHLSEQVITIVVLPRLVSLLHPHLNGEPAADQQVVSDAVLTGPGFPVLERLELLRKPEDGGEKKEQQEPSIDFCVLRVHPKMTPVAYLEWPKEGVRRAGLKALNTSEQLNLKGVAPATTYRDLLRGVRYHHGYPFALNSSSFVLVCLEHNARRGADGGSSAMLLLRLRIHHEVTAAPNAVPGLLRQPPPAIMHEENVPSFEEKGPNLASSNLRSHEAPSHPASVRGSPAGTWSVGAIVGFVLGLFFLALATYLAVLRWRRYRRAVLAAGGPGPGFDPRGPFGGLARAESHERHVGASGLEMEWDNSELNITVNPMQETFTKYCQVVHYREFSSDDETGGDEEDLSSLLSGIPEEGEEEAGRSLTSAGSLGGSGGSGSGGGGEEEEWQWEDDMLPAYTHRPAANARV